MPFAKGNKKPAGSGRKAGGLSPKKLSREVAARLNELGCDPVEQLARIAMGEKVNGLIPEANTQQRAASELMKYIYPRLSAIDHRLVDAEGNDRSVLDELDRCVALADARRSSLPA